MDSRCGAVADRRARGVRVPRRDRHGAGREGRRAQPDEHAGAGTSGRRPGRRTARTIAYFSDDGGEYALRHRAARTARASRARSRSTGEGFYDAARSGRPTARRSRTSTTRRVGLLGRRRRPARRRSIDGAAASTRPGVVIAHALVARLEVDRLRRGQSAAARHDRPRVLDRAGQVVPDHATASATSAIPVFDGAASTCIFFGSTDAGPGGGLVRAVERRHARDVRQRLSRRAAQRPAVAARAGERRGEAGRRRSKARREAGEKPAGRSKRTDAEGTPATSRAVPDRPRRHRVPHSRPADRRPAARRTCRPARPGTSTTCGPSDGRTALDRYDLNTRKNETLLPEASRLRAVGRRQEAAVSQRQRVVDRRDDGTDRAGGGADCRRRDSRCGSIRAPSGSRSSTRPGASIATTSTRRTCTAWTGRRCRRSTQPFLADLATRADLNRVHAVDVERAVGRPPPRRRRRHRSPSRRRVPGGLLGADYAVENGRYRFKKVYGGLNWNPQLRAPLTEPGVNVRRRASTCSPCAGKDVRPPANVYSFFENTAGKIVEITVGPNPDGSGSRTVQVVPVANEGGAPQSRLGRRQPEEGERGDRRPRRVRLRARTPAAQGHAYFKRYFYPQAHKDAVIVDERFNGGGQVADYYIDLLRRPLIAYWAMRYGADLKTPTASIQGPKVDDHRRDRRLRRRSAAVDVPQVQARVRSSGSARGADSSASSASRC